LLTVAELAPRPTAAFTAWQQHTPAAAAQRWKRLRGYAHTTAPKAQVVARKSMEQPMVATETLGKLLAKQGQYAKAIKVYEQLSLVNPEKSSSFAATIQELKQKL
jgi:Flp pilus assembly protein TadD